jgi:3-oxoacyl-[acyl-carrier-protein] synthase III
VRRTQFLGTGFSVPDRVVTNDDLAKLMDTSDEWIQERTGIRERRWVREGQTSVDLALPAAYQAIEAAGLTPGDIDAIVFATSTPDHFCPGNGVYLQRALGAGDIPALDVRNQCAGFIYGLSVADGWIRSGQYSRVLLVGEEIQSTGMDLSTEGRHTAVIFADGAGAVVLGASDVDDGRGILGFDLHTDGHYAEKLWVFRHAVVKMPKSAKAVLERLGLTFADVSLFIPHQANLRISEAIQKSLGLREDQVYNNIMTYGNTTSATIPIALDECVRSGRLKRGDLVVLTAFGSGFMWGSCVIRW